jgi:NADH-quinone oxidoreductase subunit C
VSAGGAVATSHGMLSDHGSADKVFALVRRLKSELLFDLLLDITAVDWPQRTPRFDVVYHFYSTSHFSVSG